MCKTISLYTLVMFVIVCQAKPQSIQLHGYALKQNSAYSSRDNQVQYISGAIISAKGANPTTSDNEGKFLLEFVGVPQGTEVVISIEKQGHVLVNEPELQHVVVGQTYPLKAYFATRDEFSMAQMNLLDISVKALTREHDQIIEQLRGDSLISATALKDFQNRCAISFKDHWEAEEYLQKQLQELKNKLPIRIAELAKVNLDFASQEYRSAHEFFLQGKIDSALRALDESTMNTSITDSQEKQSSIEIRRLETEELKSTTKENLQIVLDAYNFKSTLWELKFDYLSAKGTLEKTLAIQERLFGGKDDNRLVGTLERLSNISFYSLEAAKAVYFGHRLLSIELAQAPQNESQVAVAYSCISNGYTLIRYDSAEYYAIKNHELRERISTSGQCRICTATSASNLGSIYTNMGEYRKAIALLEEAVSIESEILAPNDPSKGITLNNLAMAYRGWGDIPKAIEAMEKAIAIDLQALAPTHPTLALHYENLSMCYYFKSPPDIVLAEKALENALEINEKLPNPDYNRIINLLNIHATLKLESLQLQDALVSGEKSLALHPKTAHPDSAVFGATFYILSECYYHAGSLKKAEDAVIKSILCLKSSLGENHPTISSAYMNYACILFSMGKKEEAIKFAELSVKISSAHLKPDNPELLRQKSNLHQFKSTSPQRKAN